MTFNILNTVVELFDKLTEFGWTVLCHDRTFTNR